MKKTKIYENELFAKELNEAGFLEDRSSKKQAYKNLREVKILYDHELKSLINAINNNGKFNDTLEKFKFVADEYGRLTTEQIVDVIDIPDHELRLLAFNRVNQFVLKCVEDDELLDKVIFELKRKDGEKGCVATITLKPTHLDDYLYYIQAYEDSKDYQVKTVKRIFKYIGFTILVLLFATGIMAMVDTIIKRI